MSCKSVPWVWTSLIFRRPKLKQKIVKFGVPLRSIFGTRGGKKLIFVCFILTKRQTNFLLNLIHGFHETLLKFSFCIFAKLEVRQIFYFRVFYLLLLRKVLNDFIQNKNICTCQTSKQNFFDILHLIFKTNFFLKWLFCLYICNSKNRFTLTINYFNNAEARNTKNESFKKCVFMASLVT